MDVKTILTQIYNTLGTVDTHGENTMKMAACLDALKQVITAISEPETEDLPIEPDPEVESEENN